MNLIQGEGPDNAKLFFVGTAPDALEAKAGRPFVGRTNKLLTDLMEEVGIRRSECYMTNCVKIRPTHDRVPHSTELSQFKTWLNGELYAVRPRLVIAVGATAMGVMLPGMAISPISRVHGEIYQSPHFFHTMPILHPSMVSRMRDTELLIKRDLRKAMKYVAESHTSYTQ